MKRKGTPVARHVSRAWGDSHAIAPQPFHYGSIAARIARLAQAEMESAMAADEARAVKAAAREARRASRHARMAEKMTRRRTKLAAVNSSGLKVAVDHSTARIDGTLTAPRPVRSAHFAGTCEGLMETR